MLTLVTWNVNSIRLRLPHLQRLMKALRPDVLCLQEIKVESGLFPAAAFAEIGLPHLAVAGMKGYNGVAIASRLPLSNIRVHHHCDREDARHIQATLAGVDVHCLYVPAGGDIPDPELNPRFAHKLAFLRAMTDHFAGIHGMRDPLILAGDLNVAPLENDVWSHRQLLNVVSHTPVEVHRLELLRESLDWVDGVRRFVPPEEKLYTWWSYRNRDWRKSNRGRRLDHIWVTPPLAPALRDFEIVGDARDWDPPSDHAPVAVTLDLPV